MNSQLPTHAARGRPRRDIRSHSDGFEIAMSGDLYEGIH